MNKMIAIGLLVIAALLLSACFEAGIAELHNPLAAYCPDTYEADDDIPNWMDYLITDEHPQEFWDNQIFYHTVAEGIDAMFPLNTDTMRRLYPDFFGGMYFCQDNMGRLTVLIVEAFANDDETLAFLARVEELGGANIRLVGFSECDLIAAQEYIFSKWDTHPAMQNVRSTWVDTMANRLQINLLYGDDDDIAQFKSEILDSPMLAFTGTRSREFALGDIAEPLRINPLLEGMRMEVSCMENMPHGLTVTIYNDSRYMVMGGLSFSVEGFDGEQWRQVPLSGFFHMIGIIINRQQSHDFEKDIASMVGLLAPGLYRIRKHVFRDMDAPIRDEHIQDLIAEFYVREQ